MEPKSKALKIRLTPRQYRRLKMALAERGTTFQSAAEEALALWLERGAQPRVLGSAKGLFTVPEDFNEPLPDDLLESFYR
jgi:hypothetical protein